MIFSFALKNPQVTASAIENYNTPGQVQTEKLRQSAADFAMQTLNCYHKSARFRGVEVIGSPWQGQDKFGAEQSLIMRINLAGITGTSYQMIVAAMAKGRSYRTFVLSENTIVPYNKNCSLESWTQSGASE